MAWNIQEPKMTEAMSRLEIFPGITYNTNVNIITVNGFQIKCRIVQDHRYIRGENAAHHVPYITIIDNDGRYKHLFLHAISTIEEV